jgi:hypothetical protein
MTESRTVVEPSRRTPVVGSTPGEFASFIHAESEKWTKIVRATGATAE